METSSEWNLALREVEPGEVELRERRCDPYARSCIWSGWIRQDRTSVRASSGYVWCLCFRQSALARQGGTNRWWFQDPGETLAVNYALRGKPYLDIYREACQ